MLQFTSAQMNAWMVMLLWPATRILAAISVAPLFGHTNIPNTVKLGLGLLLSIAVAPTLLALPEVAPFSGEGLLILVQQVLIGLAIGFSMKLAFTGIELAGEPNRLHSDFVNGIKTMPIRFTPTSKLNK